MVHVRIIWCAWVSHGKNRETAHAQSERRMEQSPQTIHRTNMCALEPVLKVSKHKTMTYQSTHQCSPFPGWKCAKLPGGQKIYSSHVSIDIWGRWWKCNFTLALRHLNHSIFRTRRTEMDPTERFLFQVTPGRSTHTRTRGLCSNRKPTSESMTNIFLLPLPIPFHYPYIMNIYLYHTMLNQFFALSMCKTTKPKM